VALLTLLSGRGTNELPPHLRAKAAAGSSQDKATPPPATVSSGPPVTAALVAQTVPAKTSEEIKDKATDQATSINKHKTAHVVKKQIETNAGDVTIKPQGTAFTFTTNQTPQTFQVPTFTPELKALQGSKNNPIVIDFCDNSSPPPTDPTATCKQDNEVMHVLAVLKREVWMLTNKVHILEDDNMQLNQKVQELAENDKRRRFLGTGDANEPFQVNVTYCKSIGTHSSKRLDDNVLQPTEPPAKFKSAREAVSLRSFVLLASMPASLPPRARIRVSASTAN
jgi:hypothetical protein